MPAIAPRKPSPKRISVRKSTRRAAAPVYHVAPADIRSSILRKGIDFRLGDSGTDYDEIGTPPGNYFWGDRDSAVKNLVRQAAYWGSARAWDLWEIVPTGISLKPNVCSWGGLYTDRPIPTSLIRLVAP